MSDWVFWPSDLSATCKNLAKAAFADDSNFPTIDSRLLGTRSECGEHLKKLGTRSKELVEATLRIAGWYFKNSLTLESTEKQ